MTDAPSLREYANEKARGRPDKCFTCRHPYRAEIEAARLEFNDSYGVIASWLREHHPEHAIRELTLRNHFESGHARPA